MIRVLAASLPEKPGWDFKPITVKGNSFDGGYTIKRPRKSIGYAIEAPSTDGYKTRAARLLESLGGRYTGRDKAYILPYTKVARFRQLYAEGWDANVISRDLVPPRNNRNPK